MAEPVSGPAPRFGDWPQPSIAATLGMWLFLVTETLFFGGLFLGYFVYRYLYPEAFAAAAQHLHLLLGGINSALLITSSLAMSLAELAAAGGRRRTLLSLLGAAALLGLAFLAVKGIEYRAEFREGLAPFLGQPFRFDGPGANQAELFFHFYFAMTGLHALHLLVGIGLIALLMAVSWLRGRVPAKLLNLSGLYWHFVDLVWVLLFAALYLMGRYG